MIKYSVVGILYTRTCPLSCRHCIISSSPKAKDKMKPETARALLEQIPQFCDTVCFTGGEPMLYYNEIIPLIRYAVSLGLKVTMVTGAGWVSPSKPEIALERIQGLKDAGLSMLCVSWDIYHEEYSRPENALLVIEHAKSIGLAVNVRGVVPADGAKPEIEDRLVQIRVSYEKVPVIRLGHAETLPEDHFMFMDEVGRGGCSTVLTPTVEPDGTVYACCGPSRSSKRPSPLVLGNSFEESLTAILTRGVQDPILEAIQRIGPFGLYHLLKDEPAVQDVLPRRSSYTGICELCLDLCDVPALVSQLRERLTHSDARALVAAARMLQSTVPVPSEQPMYV
jgi:hypothetical protein